MQIEVINVAEVFDRIKLALSISKDADLARAFEEAPKKIGVWRHRNTVPYEELITFCRQNNLNFEWVFLGKGEMHRGEVSEPILPYGTALAIGKIAPSEKLKLKLVNRLIRIIDEGDEKKIKAVEAQLDLLDPGEKKQGVDCPKNAGVGT